MYYSPGTYKKEDRGGVLILAKTALNPVMSDKTNVEAEHLWIEITPRPRLTYLIGMNRVV